MKRLIYRIWLWFQTPVTYRTTDTMDAWGSRLVTEYEVLNRRGKVIGYWAYGNYDPNCRYQGDGATGELK